MSILKWCLQGPRWPMLCATQGSFRKHWFKWNSARVLQPALSPALEHIVSRWGAEGIRRNPFSGEDLGVIAQGAQTKNMTVSWQEESNGLHVTCLEKELGVRRGTTHMSHWNGKNCKEPNMTQFASVIAKEVNPCSPLLKGDNHTVAKKMDTSAASQG